jgi:hypothetical protein
VFDSAEFRDRVAALLSLPHKHFTLFFRQWTRLAPAQKVTAGSLVHLAVEGIPPIPGTVRRWITCWALPAPWMRWRRRRRTDLI